MQEKSTPGFSALRDIIEGKPKQVIRMYVRRVHAVDASIKTRTISLTPIPDRVSQDEFLALGFAYDGDSVTKSVDKFTMLDMDKNGKPKFTWFGDEADLDTYQAAWTLADALNNAQRTLVEWLRSLGYEVKIA